MPMLANPRAKYRPFAPVRLPDRTWPDAVLSRAPIWCSVDLRDGNQALIEPMDPTRKLRLFETLVAIGFKEIEVGFPSASQADFDFVRLLIEEDRIPADVTIQVLTQARQHLIERTFEALVDAPRAIVHLYNATAPVMRRVVLGLEEDGIVALAVDHARMVAELAARQPATQWTLQYSPEMFSGTELAFSLRVVDAVTAVWQPTPASKCIINLPSTVEHSTPNVYADMVEWMHRHLQRREAILLSVHPHNDRGTGTAAGELALMAGADRIEGCLFGNGERTGNVDEVNIALNLYTQGVPPGLDFSAIDDIRRTVEHCNQLPVHPRHPYVGDLVYTSFSGSHQDAIKKAFAARREGDIWDMPYLPIDPKDLGRSYEAVIRVNSQSGKGGITYLLENAYGLTLPRRAQIEFSRAAQAVMDEQGTELTAADIWTLFSRTYGLAPALRIEHLSIRECAAPGTAGAGQGQVQLRATVHTPEGAWPVQGEGQGPVHAFVAALAAASGTPMEVLDLQEQTLPNDSQPRVAAYAEMRVAGGATLFGAGISSNSLNATLHAVLSACWRAGGAAVAPHFLPTEQAALAAA